MAFSAGKLALSLVLIKLAAAQLAIDEHIWSVVAFTHHGDRTPIMFSDPSTLTPLGAQQMYNTGTYFRKRYIETKPLNSSAEVTRIRGIAPSQMSYSQLEILSTDEQHVFASAQACLQGLYPPLQMLNSSTYITNVSPLGDGSNAVAPLSGYQYPNILTATGSELNSIYVSGSYGCPAYEASTAEYFSSSDFNFQQTVSQSTYNQLYPFLRGAFMNATLNYANAYLIWDYLNYQYVHNATVAQTLNSTLLKTAKMYADDQIFALNANLSASGKTQNDRIRVIAGRTLATRIWQTFASNINSQGRTDKLTLLFGGSEPMVAFASLAQLMSVNYPAFLETPAPGSSFVFELYTLESLKTMSYPRPSDLRVRFMYRSGSALNSTSWEYPLFGRGRSQSGMLLTEFFGGLDKFMVFNHQEWCTTCGSYSLFCPAFTGSTDSTSTVGGTTQNSRGMNPAVAGVIGAVAALGVAVLIFAAAMLFGGVRLYRNRRNGKSDLAGFRGGEKMASDQDLVIPKNGATATTIPAETPKPAPRERVGSWELKDQAKAKEIQRSLHVGAFQQNRPSFEDDDLAVHEHAIPTRPRDQV